MSSVQEESLVQWHGLLRQVMVHNLSAEVSTKVL